MLRLDDLWVWDSWIVYDGARHHLFFLQAPRSLGDPARRHLHARVGHASSPDLVAWTYHGECLGPSGGGFDDRAIWTGSVLAAGGRWWMFYTALSAAGPDPYAQRIGAAVSDDLHTWRRVSDRPLLDLDPLRYRALEPGGPGRSGHTWLDPVDFADPGGDGWHMLLTAAAAGSDPDDGGVIGHATSPDLVRWTVRDPLSVPGAGFRHLEVPHAHEIDRRAVLTFTCHPDETVPSRTAADGRYCTWSVPGPGVAGPWDVGAARPFTADAALFAAPLTRRRAGTWVILGFRHLESEGGDGFAIHDPIPVTTDAAGYLVGTGPTESRGTTSQGR